MRTRPKLHLLLAMVHVHTAAAWLVIPIGRAFGETAAYNLLCIVGLPLARNRHQAAFNH